MPTARIRGGCGAVAVEEGEGTLLGGTAVAKNGQLPQLRSGTPKMQAHSQKCAVNDLLIKVCTG